MAVVLCWHCCDCGVWKSSLWLLLWRCGVLALWCGCGGFFHCGGDRFILLCWSSFCFIVVVAAFNILSSLVMLVRSKTRDIAILRTLGATPRSIQAIFILLGESNMALHQDPISLDKLHKLLVTPVNRILGFVFDLHRMTLGTPPEFIFGAT